jgi:hypothetical protein
VDEARRLIPGKRELALRLELDAGARARGRQRERHQVLEDMDLAARGAAPRRGSREEGGACAGVITRPVSPKIVSTNSAP